MRYFALAAILSLMPFTASAQELMLSPGNWNTTTDIFSEAYVNGERMEIPSDHDAELECWTTDDELAIDEALVAIDDCTITNSQTTEFGLTFELVCLSDGVAMSGGAEIYVNKARDMFSGYLHLGHTSNGISIEVTGIMMGQNTGSC